MLLMFILMFLPLLELPLLLVLPVHVFIWIYLASFPATFWIYWLMKRNRKRPVTTGRESLPGRELEILSVNRRRPGNVYTVRTEGEWWDAWSDDDLRPGEKVVVTACRGNRLIVRKKEQDPAVMKDRTL